MTAGVVIVGAGQAGLQVALSLREGGYAGPVTLVGEEAGLPYGRPPLSKTFRKGMDAPDTLWLRPDSALESRANRKCRSACGWPKRGGISRWPRPAGRLPYAGLLPWDEARTPAGLRSRLGQARP